MHSPSVLVICKFVCTGFECSGQQQIGSYSYTSTCIVKRFVLMICMHVTVHFESKYMICSQEVVCTFRTVFSILIVVFSFDM